MYERVQDTILEAKPELDVFLLLAMCSGCLF